MDVIAHDRARPAGEALRFDRLSEGFRDERAVVGVELHCGMRQPLVGFAIELADNTPVGLAQLAPEVEFAEVAEYRVADCLR